MSKQVSTLPRTPRQNTAARTPAKPAARTGSSLRKSAPAAVKPFNMPFEQKNLMIILAGVATIGLGYLLMWSSPTMSQMALTVSPIILLLGYCVIVPMGIMAGSKTFKKQPTSLGEQPTNSPA